MDVADVDNLASKNLSNVARSCIGMTAIDARELAGGADSPGRRLAKWSPHDRRLAKWSPHDRRLAKWSAHDRRLAERSEAWRRRRPQVSARSARRSRRRMPMSSGPVFPLCMNTPPVNRSHCALNLVRARTYIHRYDSDRSPRSRGRRRHSRSSTEARNERSGDAAGRECPRVTRVDRDRPCRCRHDWFSRYA